MFIERATRKKFFLRSSGAKHKLVSRTMAGNIALRWSASYWVIALSINIRLLWSHKLCHGATT